MTSKNTKTLLFIGSLLFLIALIFIVSYLVSELLFIAEDKNSYLYFLGTLGFIAVVLSIVVLFIMVRCPRCDQNFIVFPWKRKESDIQPKEQVINGLLHKKLVFGNCDYNLDDRA